MLFNKDVIIIIIIIIIIIMARPTWMRGQYQVKRVAHLAQWVIRGIWNISVLIKKFLSVSPSRLHYI